MQRPKARRFKSFGTHFVSPLLPCSLLILIQDDVHCIRRQVLMKIVINLNSRRPTASPNAFDLFQRGIAPVVITTGGFGYDPDFSEGGDGRDYLMHRGIPERSLIAETQSSHSAQSAVRVAVIMHANGMGSCVAVSDEYHVFRIKELLEHQGLKVYVAPRSGSRPHTRWQRCLALLRESVSYLLWRLHLPV